MLNHDGVNIAAATTAAFLGLLGRLMSMTHERRNPLRWSLAWELPAAIGLGIIGRAVGEYAGLTGFALWACSIVVAYMGPGFLSYWVARLSRSGDWREK